jgi:hypothetical protein
VEGAGGGVLDNERRELAIPDLSKAAVAMSTPRVYRARTVREAQNIRGDGAAIPVVTRDFSRTERILIRFDLYGATDATAALLNRTGQKMADVPVAAATAGGTHLIDLPLGGMAAGEYVVEIKGTKDGAEAKELVPLKVGS